MIGQQELTFEDLLAILRRRWWIVAASLLFGVCAAYGLCRFLPKRYTSGTLVLVEPPTVPQNYIQPVVSGTLSQRLVSMTEQVLSRTRLEPVIEQFNLYQEDRAKVPVEDLVSRLRKAIKITPIRPTPGTESNGLPGFTISVTLASPQLAQQVCAQVTSMFMEQNLRLRQSQAEDTTQFLTSQLEDAGEKLNAQDAKLAAFQRRYMNVLPDNASTNLNLLNSTTSQLEAVTQTLSRAQEDKSFTQSMLAQQLQAWKVAQAPQNSNTLQQQLRTLENQLIALEARYTDSYPDVIKTKRDIAQLKKTIQDANVQEQSKSTADTKDSTSSSVVEPPQIQQLRVRIHQDDVAIQEATKREQGLQNQMQTLQARLQLSPSISEEYKQLTRDHQTALDFYNGLLKKQKDAEIATELEQRQQSEQFRVLDPANLPDKPSFPDPLRIYSGGAGGGIALGFGMIILLELSDKKIRTEEEVQHFLELPTLAVIPSFEPSQAVSGGKAKPTRTVVARSSLPSTRT